MALTIKIKSGSQAGYERSFDVDEITFGRDPECDVLLDDIEVSRQHAKIYIAASDTFIEDLKSTNGTFLNGREVKKPQVVRNGDLITLGESVVLEFSADQPEVQVQHPHIDHEETTSGQDEMHLPPAENALKSPIAAVSPIMAMPEGEKLINKLPSWLIILVIALAFLVFFCFIPFIIIEVSNQWCNLFSGFFNAISPGACP